MTFNEYQEFTKITAVYPKDRAVEYCTLGLANEAGEVAGKLKKVYRDNDGILDDEQKTKLVKECGDVLWYLARLTDELGFRLEDVAESNKANLLGRVERGTIHGSGDDR